jgi:hypothetical protein
MSSIKTKRDKPALVHDQYMYRFDRLSADAGKFLGCIRDSCVGRIKADGNEVFVEYRNATHSHLANSDEVQVSAVVTKLKERAESETISRHVTTVRTRLVGRPKRLALKRQ